MKSAGPDLFPHHSEASLRAARDHLAAVDAALKRADAEVPPLAWRKRPGGFAGLVKMVVEQQVSVASAAAIWRRVEHGLGEISPARVLQHSEDELKTFGLSRPKARYARAIAEAVSVGAIDFDGLIHLQDDEAVARLTALKGVGRWTAETYLMFCEGRLDVFPAGDVALQEAVRVADLAEARLSEKALYERAEAWRPYRGVAAHLLWAYYGRLKRGEVGPPAL
jgi:DNA-3-methyladenine glycosylase II